MNQTLLQLMEETEIVSIKNAEIKSQEILYELKNMTGFQVPIIKGMSARNMIICLLYDSNFPLKPVLVSLLQKYHVNERDLLLELSVRLYPPSSQLKSAIKKEFSTLPYCMGLEEQNNHYRIQTKYGILEMYRLVDWIKNKKIKIQLQNKNFSRLCHEAAQTFSPYMKEDYITTSEMQGLFGGVYYHSYYTLENGDGMVDLARCIFYPGDCFDEIFKPKILLQYKAKELKERYLEYLKNSNEEQIMYPVLTLALHEKRKRL